MNAKAIVELAFSKEHPGIFPDEIDEGTKIEFEKKVKAGYPRSFHPHLDVALEAFFYDL